MNFLYLLGLLCGAVAAGAATRIRRGAWGPPAFGQVSAVTLTPLSVLFAFVVGFLAVQVWTSWDRAAAHVAQEASALQDAMLLADAADPELGRNLRADLSTYLRAVPAEWTAMRSEQALLPASPAGLRAAVHRVAVHGDSSGRPVIADRILRALDVAGEARRERWLLNAHSVLGPGRWAALIGLAAALQLTIAIVHAHNRPAQAIALATFTIAAALALSLVAASDRPYRAWPQAVGPGPLLELASAADDGRGGVSRGGGD